MNRSTFDFETWAEGHLENVQRRGHGPEFTARCPECDHNDGSFTFNSAKGVFNCWRATCSLGGGTAFQLVARVEGVPLELVLRKYRSSLKTVRKTVHKNPTTFKVSLPPETIMCFDEHRNPKVRTIRYLVDRQINNECLQRYRIGFCTAGTYRNRVILPVRSPGIEAFQARDVTGSARAKYLNPPGNWSARALGGWDVYQKYSHGRPLLGRRFLRCSEVGQAPNSSHVPVWQTASSASTRFVGRVGTNMLRYDFPRP